MKESAVSDVTVRPATIDDVEVLVRFSAALAKETEGRVLEETRLREGIRAVLACSDHGFYLVAEASPAVVGQLLITYEWSDWRNAAFWWIQSVYVERAWRRRGVFRRMYRHVYAEARSRAGVCGLRLYVETENTTAKAVYQKLGLVPAHYEVLEADFVLSHTTLLTPR